MRARSRRSRQVLLAGLLMVGAALLSAVTHADELTRAETPAAAGLRSAPLAGLLSHVTQARLDVRSLMVARHGAVAFEWHSALSSPEHNHKVFSVTKSVVSLLLGQALSPQASPRPSTSRPAHPSPATTLGEIFGVAARDSQLASLTLEHLLTMRSGLAKTRAPAPAFMALHRAPDRIAHILAQRTVRAPDTKFQYGNAETQLLAGAVQTLTGTALHEYAEQMLFGPMQFRNHHWQHPDATGLVTGGYGLRLRTIDMAKLGQLALNEGRWNPRQLVPQAYVQRATRAGPDAFYGYQWWVNIAAGGYQSFAALGLGGQVVQVIPELELVFVMTAELPRAQTREVRRTLVEQFVIPAASSGSDTAADRLELDAVRARTREYRPAAIPVRNLPQPPA